MKTPTLFWKITTVLSLAAVVGSSVLAAVTGPNLATVSDGDPLTATGWNAVVNEINTYNQANKIVRQHSDGSIQAASICDENGANCKDVSGGWAASAGTLTNGKWCSTDGSTISCTEDAPNASQWTTSGSDVYYGSGNVGIGSAVTTPAHLFHVGVLEGSQAGVSAMAAFTNSGSAYVGFRQTTNDVEMFIDPQVSGGKFGTMTSHPLTIRTANADRVTIDAAGNVGIGVASTSWKTTIQANASTQNALELKSSADTGGIEYTGLLFDTVGTDVAGIYTRDTDGVLSVAGVDGVQLKYGFGGISSGNVGLSLNSSGNVGIGNSSPTEQFHVGAGGDASGVVATLISANASGASNIAVIDSTNDIEAQFGVDNSTGGARIGTYSSHEVDFVVGNTVRATIDTSGNTSFTGNVVSSGQLASTQASTMTPAGTTQTIDWNTSNAQELDLGSATGDVTLTLSNPVAGGAYFLKIIQGATARQLTWPANVKWPGGTAHTVTTTDDAIDSISLYYDGTNYLANGSADYQ